MTRLGFIGAGKMATALARGFAGSDLDLQITAFDINEQTLSEFCKACGATAVESNHELVSGCDIIIVAIKPQQATAVINEIRTEVTPAHLLISVVSGIPLARFESDFSREVRAVRVMPNTPALLRAGASAFATNSATTTKDRAFVRSLLETVGIAEEVTESLLDAVTGLSGSGPAYVYQFIEALADGGVYCGLPRAIAMRLAAQTVLGAAKMVLGTGEHPGELKDAVASPGGTTITGLSVLESRGVRGAVIEAVAAASQRAIELGSQM